MKRILIFSDTHGYTDPCLSIINNTPRVDAVIHAGDYTRDAEDLSYIYPDL
ncbi:MAG: metallophosphoesterase, partial [Clostridia bacterium]|nr:metallophosphoesterase [Clostridia bacterium]